jgi:TetR/AcrR family transcriptional repressor of mexJK operon
MNESVILHDRAACCRGRRPDPGKREAIVAAAVRLFMAHGYGVSMEAIAAAAGVSKQTIYNLFSTKEQLFAAVVADHSQIVVAAIDAAADDADPRRLLTAVAHELLHLLTSERIAKIYRMLMSAVIESGGKSDLPALFYENGPARGTRQFAAYLARQHERGRLTVEDPLRTAECFFGMLNGHILIRNMMGLQDRWDEDALRRRAEVCVDAFLATHAPHHD